MLGRYQTLTDSTFRLRRHLGGLRQCRRTVRTSAEGRRSGCRFRQRFRAVRTNIQCLKCQPGWLDCLRFGNVSRNGIQVLRWRFKNQCWTFRVFSLLVISVGRSSASEVFWMHRSHVRRVACQIFKADMITELAWYWFIFHFVSLGFCLLVFREFASL
jgi:hypothetical protein